MNISAILRLQDKISGPFKNIYKAGQDVENKFKNISEQLDNMSNKSSKAASSTSSVFKGVLGANVITKGLGMITGQLDSAISRFDTINNYKNVMGGLGFGAEESQKSINALKKGLDGLPGTLDDAVSSVQRFAAVNENIGASTEMTLALNDALAAGGTPAATQAAALEQISQAYAKGKFDEMEYKSMMNAMPAQLKQVAKAMGYTSTAVGGDFYNALQKGKIGMNDLMKKMVELDKQTGGFHDQALNATNGIGTAFTNMKTAITKGLADMIDNINTGLTNSRLPDIQTIIKNTGKSIQKAISTVGSVVGQLLGILQPVFTLIRNIYTFIASNWIFIAPIIGGIVAAILAYNIALGIHAAFIAVNTIAEKLHALSIYTTAKAFLAQASLALIASNAQYAYAVAAAQATVAQGGFNSALFACPLTWILLLIIGIIVAIYLLVGAINKATGSTISATGIIAGVIMVAIALIWNTVVGIINSILVIIDTVANVIISVVEWILNVCNGGFDSFGAAVANLIGNIISWFLTLGKVVTKIIDAIFGTNWTAALNSLQDKVISWGKNKDSSITLDRWDHSLNRMEYGSSWNKGYSMGQSIDKKLGNIGTALQKSSSDKDSDLTTDWSKMANNVTGTDKTGGKAVKTTSNDKLIDDDDIQLLLDVATRDYKLNYQQVTPNITLTFGDIRESVDVDDVLDEVADKLQEIYDGNLEVATT